MAKHKSDHIIIKVFPELSLVFLDEKSIWAFPLNEGRAYIFHSWWAPRFNYVNNWRPFKRALLKRRYLDKETCWSIADAYSVPYMLAETNLSLGGKPVELIYKRWSLKGTICDATKSPKG